MAREFENLDALVAWLPALREQLHDFRELLLANLVMIGEIPAPTFHEEKRVAFVVQRFSECGLQNTSVDEAGNGVGLLPGKTGDAEPPAAILVSAHADTVLPEEKDHTINVQPDRVVGAGVADNGLGLAAMATLPTLLASLDITLRSDLLLMASVRSLGRGDIGGMNFFLNNNTLPIRFGLCLEGAELGRCSYASEGMLRGEIRCHVPEAYDWVRQGMMGSIFVMNEVVTQMLGIPTPRKPRTLIVMGSLEAGTGFSQFPSHAVLRFEVRSESSEQVNSIHTQICDIVADISSRTGAELTLEILARRTPGGLKIQHPLVRTARAIMDALAIRPRITPSMSDLAALVTCGIPGITLGLSKAGHLAEKGECVYLDPMFTGLSQMIGLLVAMDRGFCDASE